MVFFADDLSETPPSTGPRHTGIFGQIWPLNQRLKRALAPAIRLPVHGLGLCDGGDGHHWDISGVHELKISGWPSWPG
jgi:hypothetical protein